MEDFADSFNFVVGTKNMNIDLFDNPYVAINAYEVNQSWQAKISPTMKLKTCTRNDMLQFIDEAALIFYPNSLCFEDKGQVSWYSNTNYDEFKQIFISIEACNPNLYKGECKSQEEIDEFVSTNQFYYTKQDNFVNKHIYSYSLEVDHHFSNGDPNNYFPLMKQSDMLFAQTLDNSNKKKDLVHMNELIYQVDSIEIDDSYLQLGFTSREKEFLNLKSNKRYEVNRKFLVDSEIKNDPIQVFIFGMSTVGKSYERNVYNINDMLGNVGGIYGILQTLAGVVAYVCSRNTVDTKFISIFQDPQYKVADNMRVKINKKLTDI